MFGRSGHTLSVPPTPSCPACLRRAAVTELSTPPDMPTITRAIGGILSERGLDQVTLFVHRVSFVDAPCPNGGLLAQADQNPQGGGIARQANVSRRRTGLGMRV